MRIAKRHTHTEKQRVDKQTELLLYVISVMKNNKEKDDHSGNEPVSITDDSVENTDEFAMPDELKMALEESENWNPDSDEFAETCLVEFQHEALRILGHD